MNCPATSVQQLIHWLQFVTCLSRSCAQLLASDWIKAAGANGWLQIPGIQKKPFRQLDMNINFGQYGVNATSGARPAHETTIMLTIKRPTPTTVSYTVSTRSEPRTFAAQLTNAISIMLRLAAGVLILLALLHEHHAVFAGTIYSLPSKLHALLPVLPAIATLPPALRIGAYASVLWLVFRKGYTSESLLVVRGLGVQTATAGSSFLWGGSTRFIAASAVQDVFIHEAFRGFEVRFYLCIVVEGEEGVVVVFPVCLDSTTC
jgi:phosphatidylinositol glycan class H protein